MVVVVVVGLCGGSCVVVVWLLCGGSCVVVEGLFILAIILLLLLSFHRHSRDLLAFSY